MNEARFSEIICPECGHHPTRWRHCNRIKCEDGRIDLYRENAVLHPYGPGKKYRTCGRCNGKGIIQWCPECGEDLNKHDDLQSPRERYA